MGEAQRRDGDLKGPTTLEARVAELLELDLSEDYITIGERYYLPVPQDLIEELRAALAEEPTADDHHVMERARWQAWRSVVMQGLAKLAKEQDGASERVSGLVKRANAEAANVRREHLCIATPASTKAPAVGDGPQHNHDPVSWGLLEASTLVADIVESGDEASELCRVSLNRARVHRVRGAVARARVTLAGVTDSLGETVRALDGELANAESDAERDEIMRMYLLRAMRRGAAGTRERAPTEGAA